MIHGIISVGGLYMIIGINVILTVAEKIVSLFH